jgi:hypothetical protein
VNYRSPTIGYNRTVKLKWLDETLDLFLSGQSETETYDALRETLSDQLSVGRSPQRGSREKTITLLLKTWVRVPPRVRGLRDDAVHLLESMRRSERLPLHWGMTMAVYPFWRVVADVTGRLFRLQGNVSAREIQRRVRELKGEREVVSRSTRYVLRAFADWGVLVGTGDQGTYVPVAPNQINDIPLATWMLEATLFASDTTSIDFRSLANSPALFPFHLPPMSPESLTRSCRLEIVRHGVSDDLVVLREPAQGIEHGAPGTHRTK